MAAYAGVTSAEADVIVRYDFAPHTQTYANPDYYDASVTATEYRGHAPDVSSTIISGTHVMNVDGNDLKLASFEAAVEAGIFGEFSITTTANMAVNLTSLDINMRQDNAAAGESFTVYLRASNDDFTDHIIDVGSVSLVRPDDAPAGAYGPEPRQFLLDDPAFQDLTGTLALRLYMVTDIDSSASSTQRIRIMPNVVLNGTVTPIPEPGSLALCAIGGTLLMLRRRGGVTR